MERAERRIEPIHDGPLWLNSAALRGCTHWGSFPRIGIPRMVALMTAAMVHIAAAPNQA